MKLKKFVLWLLIGVGVVGVGVLSISAYNRVCSASDILSGRTSYPPISYKSLSSEKRHPFLRLGKPFLDRAEYLPEKKYIAYKRAIEKWPNVHSCLIASEQKKEKPNLVLFNWGQLKTTEDAEVCLFRVMSSLANIEKAKQWFQTQGFEADKIHIIPSFDKKDKGVSLGVSWMMQDRGTPLGHSFFRKIWINFIADNCSFNVAFYADGTIRNVGVSYTIL